MIKCAIDKAFIFKRSFNRYSLPHNLQLKFELLGLAIVKWFWSSRSEGARKRGGKQPRQHQTENELKINGRKIIAEIRGWSKKSARGWEKEKVLQIFIGKWFLSFFLLLFHFHVFSKYKNFLLIYYSLFMLVFRALVLLSLKSIWKILPGGGRSDGEMLNSAAW